MNMVFLGFMLVFSDNEQKRWSSLEKFIESCVPVNKLSWSSQAQRITLPPCCATPEIYQLLFNVDKQANHPTELYSKYGCLVVGFCFEKFWDTLLECFGNAAFKKNINFQNQCMTNPKIKNPINNIGTTNNK